ncbi:MAG: hypothetical protein IH895_05140 [Planctomycetes bacterium]|nr:hypothetical protein [Planctomycetota bacterium]
MRTGTVAIIAALVIATALASGPSAFAGDPEPLIAPVCPADLNGDSIVDSADLDRLLRFYGACVNCKEDLNGDKFVDDADVAIMTRQWGPCPPEGDVFGGDRSNGDTASLADVATSLTDPENDPTPTTLDWPTCEGDLNGDTFVDEKDMARVLGSYGTCAACKEDLNRDGFVDDADAQIIDRQWGPCRPEGDVFGRDLSKGSPAFADSLSDTKDRPSDGKRRTPEDVNDDGIVDMVDILTVTKHVGRKPIGDAAFSDVNDDGRIDEYDIRAIAEYVISGESLGG